VPYCGVGDAGDRDGLASIRACKAEVGAPFGTDLEKNLGIGKEDGAGEA